MGREREEFFRESNTDEKERIFVLAFEGNDTEEIYFDALKDSTKFNDEQIFLKLLKRVKNDTNSAPNHVFNKLKREAKDEYNFGPNDELWMIIDTDRWKNIPEICDLCSRETNMFPAISNPCFEFWLLLHIKDVNDYSAVEREGILANTRVTNKKNVIDAKLTEILGSYNKSNPLPDRFLQHLELAVTRARALDSNGEVYPDNLGSHVYKLIEKIRA